MSEDDCNKNYDGEEEIVDDWEEDNDLDEPEAWKDEDVI